MHVRKFFPILQTLESSYNSVTYEVARWLHDRLHDHFRAFTVIE